MAILFNSKPRLHTDLLRELAERVLYKKSKFSFAEDLCPSWKHDFSLINPKCRFVFVDLFSRFKKFSIAGESDCRLRFFKSKDENNPNYTVNKELLYEIITSGKFKPEVIEWFNLTSENNFLNLDNGLEGNTRTALKLFLTQDLSSINDLNFKLESFDLHDGCSVLEHLDMILNLNSKEIKFQINSYRKSTPKNFRLPKLPNKRPNASRTEKIVIEFTIEDCESDLDFPDDEWTRFFQFLLLACPNLRLVNIKIVYYDVSFDVESIILRFSNAVNGILDKVFPSINCDTVASIVMEIVRYVEEPSVLKIPKDHEMLKRGKSSQIEPGCNDEQILSHVYTHLNSAGTEHTLLVNIYEQKETFTNSDPMDDYNREIIEDNLDYDVDYDDEYYGEEDSIEEGLYDSDVSY